jgi:DNA-binding transcriptional ArsR family regulator
MVAIRSTRDADFYATLFGALSEPIRIEIVSMIDATDELACTELDATLPIAKSTISYHVKILHNAGLSHSRKSGRHCFYRLHREVFGRHVPGFLEALRTRGDARIHQPRR